MPCYESPEERNAYGKRRTEMPCYDYEHEGTRQAESRALALQDRLVERTAMLCAAMTAAEDVLREFGGKPLSAKALATKIVGYSPDCGVDPADLARWWKAHKKADQERRER